MAAQGLQCRDRGQHQWYITGPFSFQCIFGPDPLTINDFNIVVGDMLVPGSGRYQKAGIIAAGVTRWCYPVAVVLDLVCCKGNTLLLAQPEEGDFVVIDQSTPPSQLVMAWNVAGIGA